MIQRAAQVTIVWLASVGCLRLAWSAEELADPPAAAAQPSAADAQLHEPALTEFDLTHWSFAPLVRPQVPSVAASAGVATLPDGSIHPVDAFLQQKLDKAGLPPLPRASKSTLLRRVTFDLTGLPPTVEEQQEFERDTSPEAWTRVVERLLASTAYGERYAQHWLDLARFAETDGFEHDLVRPEAWRYRDFVIDAFNADMPYDRFLTWQLAGDCVVPADAAATLATGFVLSGPDMPDLNLVAERRHNVLNEVTSTVGAVFLGLTLECAQCHDHKYDPVSQADFYRLRAVFDEVDWFTPQSTGRVLRQLPKTPPESRLYVRGDFRRPGALLEPGTPRVINAAMTSAAESSSGTTTSKLPADSQAAGKSSAGRRAELAAWLTRPDHPLTSRVMANRLWQYHFGQGLVRSPNDFGLMGQGPTHPELLDYLATELIRYRWSLKSMHRLLLTSAAYCRASRSEPSSPQQSPASSAAGSVRDGAVLDIAVPGSPDWWQRLVSVDPEQKLWARRVPVRLEGEAIRDAMLASAGRLSARRGGPGVMPPLPEELVATLLKKQWQTSPDEEDHRRRSIYLFVRRNLRWPLFEAFDRPDTNASCPQRNRTTTAPQALVLLNSTFSLQMSQALANSLRLEHPEQPQLWIEQAYLRCLGRLPSAAEQERGLKFLAPLASGSSPATGSSSATATATAADAGDSDRLTLFCLALFNSNECLYID